MDKYILADRTSGSIFALQVNNGALQLAVDAGSAQPEPILKDKLNANRWKLFLDNYQFGIELVDSTNEINLSLDDINTGKTFKIEIEEGQLRITQAFDVVFEESIASQSKHYVGEIGASLLIDTGINVLAATLVRINVLRPDGEEATWDGVVYQTTIIKHIMQEGDVDVPGIYKLQAYIETETMKLRGETIELYVYDAFE